MQRTLAAHLFGTVATTPSAEITAAPVDLKLTGTFAGSDEHRGYAIIGHGNGATHLYSVGAEVMPGSTLSAVFLDHVNILRGGMTMVLRLPRFPGLDSPARLPRSTALLAASDPNDAAAPSDRDHTFDPPPMPASGAILHSLNLLPAMEHGRRVGMRVGSSQDGAKIRQLLGFSTGDVVVALNGDSILDQPGSGAGALMRAINADDTVTLTVERQGQPVTITIDAMRAEAAASAFNSTL